MANPSTAALDHACFVVADLEETARKLSDSLGIGPWNIWTLEPDQSTVHGVPERFSFRMGLCPVGGASYELVTPLSGKSVYREHLDQVGVGLHHTCLVYPTLAAVREAKAMLLEEGREMLQEASGGDLFDFAYFDFPELGSAVEVLFVDVVQMPPPELVI
jgi:catechol 2,3-dioxygenase-like lactoylglutathione lyase family enzyme